MALANASTQPSMRILALCASYNRKLKTLAALKSLQTQIPEHVSLQMALADDNSSDGTLEAVLKAFPDAMAVNVGGQKYWAGAMRIGFEHFWDSRKYTHLLVFNDDCFFYDNALATLIRVANCHQGAHHQNGLVIAGSMRDPDSRQLTYGGLIKRKWWPKVYFQTVAPGAQPQAIATLNMNLALIDAHAIERVELIRPHFIHSFADFDFGLRANKEKVTVLLAPGFLGECARNTIVNTWQDKSFSFSQRREMLFQPKGLPTKPRRLYLKEHAPLAWPLIFIWPYLKFYASWLFHLIKRD